jgi:hypothetical protein
MARGKFNKRGGGPRLDAQSAEEIEYRNQQLAELEEARAQRRADSDEEDENGDAEKKEDGLEKIPEKPAVKLPKDENDGDDDVFEADEPVVEEPKAQSKKAPAPAPVTTEADHKRNMAKLAQVRKRREEAEARRKEQEEMEAEQSCHEAYEAYSTEGCTEGARVGHSRQCKAIAGQASQVRE